MQQADLVHSLLLQSAERFPEKTALVQGKRKATYIEIEQRVVSVCQWLLGHGLKCGDRVGILTDQADEYVTAYFGILAAGGIVVALNTQTSKSALSAVFADSECLIVLSHKKFQKYVSVVNEQKSIRCFVTDIPALWGDCDRTGATDLPLVEADDIAQIIYTSGTTGTPKGVMLTHRNLTANVHSTVEYLSLSERDSVMAVLPFFYSYGNSVFLTHMAVGGALIVNQSFLYPNVILDQMKTEKVTGFSGVPSSFAILLYRSAIRDYRFPNLRYVTQAGAAMSPKLASDIAEVFPGVDIIVMYGQTEAAPRLSFLEPSMILKKPGSIGKAIPGVKLKVCSADGTQVAPGEIGEIVAEGANIMKGYWKQPDETAKVLRKRRLWTGDLATIDNDGFFFIKSRKSDLIKSGAHRIAPKEIEDILMEHEDICEVAVVGCQDNILGEKIVAFVVLKDTCKCTAKDVLRHCRRNLPSFKVPHEVIMLKELPKTATGKVKKTVLKK